MKKLINLLGLSLIITLLACVSPNTGYGEEEGEKKMDYPKYEITVTQKGQEFGKIIVEFWPDIAPKHVHTFDSLITAGFFDGTAFHRVIPGFMIQGGDPNSKDKPRATWGTGDPSQKTIPAEFSDKSHERGIISTARKGNDINSATSQFFICVDDASFLDGQYTVFGQVLEGMDVVDQIVSTPRDKRDNPLDKVEMKIKKLD